MMLLGFSPILIHQLTWANNRAYPQMPFAGASVDPNMWFCLIPRVLQMV